MTGPLFLLDVAPSPPPMQSVGWLTIMVLLGVILFLAVSVSGGLIILLIRYKRKKQAASADYADYADSKATTGHET